MKIDEIKVGTVMEIEGRDRDGNLAFSRFTIIEKGWYSSKFNPAFFFHGAKCKTEKGNVGIMDFSLIEISKIVENTE